MQKGGSGKKVERLHRSIEEMYSNFTHGEWRRLKRRSGRESVMEYYTTKIMLEAYLPKRGLVLDAGSGPGRYSVELARKGYDIVMLDPVKSSIEFGKRAFRRYGLMQRLKGSHIGRIEDLSRFGSNTFDAVICLGGPLSHIMDQKLRKRAASELIRVAKPNAPILISVMGRLSVARAAPELFPEDIDAPFFKNWIRSGDYFGGWGFTAFHGFRKKEMEDLFKGKLKGTRTVALEGFTSHHREATLMKLYRSKKRFDLWKRLHLENFEDPVIVDMSSHIMLIGRKKDAQSKRRMRLTTS